MVSIILSVEEAKSSIKSKQEFLRQGVKGGEKNGNTWYGHFPQKVLLQFNVCMSHLGFLLKYRLFWCRAWGSAFLSNFLGKLMTTLWVARPKGACWQWAEGLWWGGWSRAGAVLQTCRNLPTKHLSTKNAKNNLLLHSGIWYHDWHKEGTE